MLWNLAASRDMPCGSLAGATSLRVPLVATAQEKCALRGGFPWASSCQPSEHVQLTAEILHLLLPSVSRLSFASIQHSSERGELDNQSILGAVRSGRADITNERFIMTIDRFLPELESNLSFWGPLRRVGVTVSHDRFAFAVSPSFNLSNLFPSVILLSIAFMRSVAMVASYLASKARHDGVRKPLLFYERQSWCWIYTLMGVWQSHICLLFGRQLQSFVVHSLASLSKAIESYGGKLLVPSLTYQDILAGTSISATIAQHPPVIVNSLPRTGDLLRSQSQHWLLVTASDSLRPFYAGLCTAELHRTELEELPAKFKGFMTTLCHGDLPRIQQVHWAIYRQMRERAGRMARPFCRKSHPKKRSTSFGQLRLLFESLAIAWVGTGVSCVVEALMIPDLTRAAWQMFCLRNVS